jgi:hypothetical protein
MASLARSKTCEIGGSYQSLQFSPYEKDKERSKTAPPAKYAYNGNAVERHLPCMHACYLTK